MIKLLRYLEIRHIDAKETIINELDESSELYFIQSGIYDIGYEINKVKKYRLQFGPRTIIGGFAVAFN